MGRGTSGGVSCYTPLPRNTLDLATQLLSVHGGLSPSIDTIDHIRQLPREEVPLTITLTLTLPQP